MLSCAALCYAVILYVVLCYAVRTRSHSRAAFGLAHRLHAPIRVRYISRNGFCFAAIEEEKAEKMGEAGEEEEDEDEDEREGE